MNRILIVVSALCLTMVTMLPISLQAPWHDATPGDNSLAREAQRKLAATGSFSSEDPVRQKTLSSAPRRPYIVIDTHTNQLYLRRADSVIFKALCSTGTGAELVDSAGGRTWRFDTPKGMFQIDSKLANPWWRKPDWAFLEEGQSPPADNSERLDPNVLGDYALGFGDGYFIHGTLYERLIGTAATHGCVRLRSEDIRYLYENVPVGTKVVIF